MATEWQEHFFSYTKRQRRPYHRHDNTQDSRLVITHLNSSYNHDVFLL